MKHFIAAVLLAAGLIAPASAGEGFEDVSQEMRQLAACRAEYVSLANLHLQSAALQAGSGEETLVESSIRSASNVLPHVAKVDRLLKEVMIPLIRQRSKISEADINEFFTSIFIDTMEEIGGTIHNTINAATDANDGEKIETVLELRDLLAAQTFRCDDMISTIERHHSI